MRILQPEFDKPLVPDDLETAVQEYSDTDERVENKLFKGIQCENKTIRRAEFFACVFENCKWIDCKFDRPEFTNIYFQGCDFSNAILRKSYFKQCAFTACKFMGADLSESILKELTVADTNFSYANLNAIKMQNIALKNCDCSFAEFAMVKLKNAFVQNCDFTRVNFFQTSLKELDFSDSKLEGIEISADFSELKGATINTFQAANLIKSLGVNVN